jgi:aryl-alcohol dehydrogenase-like predicted oxidoreductase
VKYKLLGKSGLRVSEICLGTLAFGRRQSWGVPKEEAQKIFDSFVEAGGNFIDTADRYSEGNSEQFVGELIADEREKFVVATKYTLGTREGDVNASGNHRKNMVQSLDASLRRLRTDYVDLYWVHAWDFLTPIEEVMRALDDMVRAGKVLYVGISNAPAWVVAQANTQAELRGWTPFVGLQPEYSLVERSAERELLPMTQALGIGVVPWGTLGIGVLSDAYSGKSQSPATGKERLPQNDPKLNERNLSIAEEVGKIADDLGRTTAEVALNWVRQQDAGIVPIVGVENVAQLKSNLACLEFELTEEQLGRLDLVSKIELGTPYDFLAQEDTKERVYGGMFDSIDVQGRFTRSGWPL